MQNTYMNTSLSFYQHTLAESFSCIGRGLHSGLKVSMTVSPAEPFTGFVFNRRDVNQINAEVPARWYTVNDTRLSTTVANNVGIRVSTIEHLLAALHGSGIDNAYITLDGPEVPILDGSAKPFIDMISGVGKIQQDAKRRALVVRQKIRVEEDGAVAELSPAAEPSFSMQISFKSQAIGQQQFHLPFSEASFASLVSDSRTFGFEEQIQTLKQLGFARGGSLANAIVISGDRVVNETGLRHPDEFVKHKCLDAIGDLALAGGYIIGHYSGKRAGHRLNNLLLRELMSNENAIENVTLLDANTVWRDIKKSTAEMTDSAY